MPSNTSRVYVEGTQRGYAVGIETMTASGPVRGKEWYSRDDGTSAGIDAAYKQACEWAASLSGSLKNARARRRLRANGWLPSPRRKA